MQFPTYVAVDSDQFVLVCNLGSNCVDLFDPMLDYVCNLTDGVRVKPQSMVFDEFTRRLYVDESFNNVGVVQL